MLLVLRLIRGDDVLEESRFGILGGDEGEAAVGEAADLKDEEAVLFEIDDSLARALSGGLELIGEEVDAVGDVVAGVIPCVIRGVVSISFIPVRPIIPLASSLLTSLALVLKLSTNFPVYGDSPFSPITPNSDIDPVELPLFEVTEAVLAS
jgi:hypothetical protein